MAAHDQTRIAPRAPAAPLGLTRKLLLLSAIALLPWMGLSATAKAAVVSAQFSGVVTSNIVGTLDLLGSPVQGSFSYDSDQLIPEGCSGPTGCWYGSTIEMTVILDGQTLYSNASDPAGYGSFGLYISNDALPFSQTGYLPSNSESFSVDTGVDLISFHFGAGAFVDDSPPSTPVVSFSFSSGDEGTGVTFLDDSHAFGWNVVSFAMTEVPDPVPEPGTLAILGVGLAGLITVRWRRPPEGHDRWCSPADGGHSHDANGGGDG